VGVDVEHFRLSVPFQSHYGAIATFFRRSAPSEIFERFQSHYGAIATDERIAPGKGIYLFQSHYGAIATL